MNEKQKIQKLLTEYQKIFEITDMDVAESQKGEWFYFRYNDTHEYYDVFAKFETAQELAEMMLGELAMDIYTTIDCEPEEQPEFPNFADNVEMKACYQPYIDRLLEYLGR